MHSPVGDSNPPQQTPVRALSGFHHSAAGDPRSAGLLVSSHSLRYPRLKLHLYFKPSRLSDCTHFCIVNYDKQLTFAEKKTEPREGEEEQNREGEEDEQNREGKEDEQNRGRKSI